MQTDSKLQLRARYTGNHEICYRWVGAIGGGRLVHAQAHPGAEIVTDTWSDDVDGRVPRKTVIRLPADLVVLDSSKKGAQHAYTAGVLDASDQKNTINWGRARHVSMERRDKVSGEPKAGKIVVHTIEVDGERGEYEEA